MSVHAIHKRRGLQMIPLKRGTVVRSRDSRSGSITGGRRGIIVGVAPSSNYSRAYGKEYFVCQLGFKGAEYAHVTRKNGSEFMAMGKVKKIPAECREALATYDQRYPSLGRKKRKR